MAWEGEARGPGSGGVRARGRASAPDPKGEARRGAAPASAPTHERPGDASRYQMRVVPRLKKLSVCCSPILHRY
jgi:hypothetical protein